MKAHSLRLAALSAIPLFGACAADGQGPTGPQVKIQTAALVLGNVTDVDYGLAVYNGDPSFDVNGDPTSAADLVWEKSSLTTSNYGNGPGGDLTYIGPCDASVAGNNFIALVINKILVTSGGSLAGGTVLDDQNTSVDNDPDFVNPCPSDKPCVLDFACVENADVGVTFNLSVMRDAEQGFFDIAVNFEDIFCSAKFDTCYDVTAGQYTTAIGQENGQSVTCYQFKDDKGNTLWAAFTGVGKGWSLWESCLSGPIAGTTVDGPASSVPREIRSGAAVYKPVTTAGSGTPIVLLHNQTTGKREHTGVAALACTAGPDTATNDIATELVFTRPIVTCANGVKFSLDLEGADGGKQSQSDDNNTGKTIEYGLYFGNETLDCGTGPGSCNKVYYNIAINLEQLAAQGLSNCRLRYAASAIEAGDESTFDEFGALVDPNAVYGGVSFGVQGGLPLTGPVREGTTPAPSCVAMPLGGTNSGVTPIYVKGSGFGDEQSGVLDYFTTGGPAEAFSTPQ